MKSPFDTRDLENFRTALRNASLVNQFLHFDNLNWLRRNGAKRVWAGCQYGCQCQIEFDSSEEETVPIVEAMLRKEYRGNEMQFVRPNIWDVRAWFKIPVSHFIECSGTDLPLIEFSCPKPMTISPACFTLKHWKYHGERKARLEFNHPTLANNRYNHGGDAKFPMETTRQEMFDTMLDKLESEAAKHNCFITTEPLIVALHKATLKLQKEAV